MANNITVDMPSGQYYIGDPIYALPSERFDEWFLPLLTGEETGKGLLDGYEYVVFWTKHGDGCFKGSDGNEYGVDGGSIAAIPAALMDDPFYEYDDFPEPFTCERNGTTGQLRFGHITIETGNDDEVNNGKE